MSRNSSPGSSIELAADVIELLRLRLVERVGRRSGSTRTNRPCARRARAGRTRSRRRNGAGCSPCCRVAGAATRARRAVSAVAAVRDAADQRLGDGEHAPRPAGEIEIVADVGAREPAQLGRRERLQSVPGAGVDIDFGRLRQRDATAVGQHQRDRDVATAVAAGDDLLQRLFHGRWSREPCRDRR